MTGQPTFLSFLTMIQRFVYNISDVFTFDNTYSWLHNKEVEYVTEVIGPYETKLDPVNKQLESLSLRDTVEGNKNVRETINSVNDTNLDMKL